MRKIKSIIWIVVFLSMIIAPVFIYTYIEGYIDSEDHENRKREARPILKGENYQTFPEEYEAYFNDNIPFRNQLIRLNNSIDYFVFKQSASDNVCIGKNGWLFYCNKDDCNPVEQSLGYWDFSDDDLKQIGANLVASKRALEKQGIEFVLFIAPNKETIYRDQLPDYYKAENQHTSTDSLVDYLEESTDITVVYPKEELLKHREENPDLILYHKLDTHWNYAGAYIGAKCLVEELGGSMPLLSEVTGAPSISSRGDLTDMLNITIKNGDIDYGISDISKLKSESKKLDSDPEFIYHTLGTDSRTLVVCRDSFSAALAPFVATQFENSVWIHTRVYEQKQIFDYKADVFVLEIAERYIRNLKGFVIE